MRKNETLRIRVTAEFRAALEARAAALHVAPAELARVVLAEKIAGALPRQSTVSKPTNRETEHGSETK